MVKYLLQVQSGFHIMFCLSATLKITDPDKATVPITVTLHICKSVTRPKVSLVQKCHSCKNSCFQDYHYYKSVTSAKLYHNFHYCKIDIHAKTSPLQKCHPYKNLDAFLNFIFQ